MMCVFQKLGIEVEKVIKNVSYTWGTYICPSLRIGVVHGFKKSLCVTNSSPHIQVPQTLFFTKTNIIIQFMFCAYIYTVHITCMYSDIKTEKKDVAREGYI